jgi:ribosomal protein S18 acetylase RimI-like enzyme
VNESSLAADEGEYLDPGYDPQTPDGDNQLLDFVRAETALWTSWGAAMDAEVVRDDTGAIWVDSGCRSVFGNPVIWARPVDRDRATDLVARMRSTYATRPGGPFLLYSPFPTPNLSSLGLSPVGHPPCMVRMPGVGDLTPDATALDVRRVNDQEGLDDFERTLVEAYPIEEVQPWRRGVMVGPSLLEHPRWHIYVGYLDGQPVATSAAYVTDHAVDVTLVSARPETRGRGFGRTLTAVAALTDPDMPAMLLASDDGQSVYRRLGFATISRFTLWVGSR